MKALRDFSTREQFLEAVRVPSIAIEHGRGSDIDQELPVLYALTMLLRPAVIVELGTRQGISARTLAQAARRVGATFVTVDIAPCETYLDGVDCFFIRESAERVFSAIREPVETARGFTARQWAGVPVFGWPDLLFIDLDPHTFEQTTVMLETWVQALRPGGVAAFHDIVPARPEIQVAEAVREWVATRPDWMWHELPGTYGLGLLWKPE
jgi:predicted O-methyltransferase YrrM